MLLFSEIDFRFSTTVSRVKKSSRQSDFAVRQEVYAKADTPWTRKPVRDKPEFYPVGSRHFVRLFSTYPSDTSVGRRLVGGEKSHAIKQF